MNLPRSIAPSVLHVKTETENLDFQQTPKKKNKLIKLLAHGGVDDGDALSLATCKRLEKGATLGRAILPTGLRTA